MPHPMLNISFSETGLIVPQTSLRDIPALARRAGVGRVLIKLESERPLGNFKVLGGMYAGLRVLADQVGSTISALVEKQGRHPDLPRLICASDGNHGLSVAAAAQSAGAPATIYLHNGVPPYRAHRIKSLGASIEWIEGTYDDAVDAAAAAARRGEGILVPDTTSDAFCPVVQHVMHGYTTLTQELVAQLACLDVRLTHSFIQAGVGGLAAAVSEGLQSIEARAGTMIVVEPESAACVARALATGEPERLAGDLATSATMLSCGLASAPALAILREYGAQAVALTEAQLDDAVLILFEEAGIATTASGAAGLAGLLHVAADAQLRNSYGLDYDSTVLLIVTEAASSQPGEKGLGGSSR